MTRALALIAIALTVAAIARIRRDARRWEAEDDYAEPVPMTWPVYKSSGGTYLYNPATGVVVSAN